MSVICLASMSGVLSAQVPAYVPTEGLVGWWPFNGNANDESGNGNDGVVFGAVPAVDRFGNSEQSYYFNGNLSNRIAINLIDSIPALSNKTISVWMKLPLSYIHSYSSIVVCDNVLPNYGETYLSTNGNEPSYVTSGTVGRFYEGKAGTMSSFPLNDDQWHHIVLINNFDSLRSELFIDGEFHASNSSNSYLGDAPVENVYFGNVANYWLTDAAIFGNLDDISIYDRALTESEIQVLYTGQCPTVATNCTSLPSNLQQGLVGYWPFCGNANDESGNGNDGTAANAVLTEDRFGNSNSAYMFDGVSSSILVSDDTELNLVEDFSIGCWFKSFSNVAQGNVSMIVNKHAVGQDNSGYTFGLWSPISMDGGLLNCQGPPHFDFVTYANEPEAVIQDTNWHQGVASYNDALNLLTYYVDGVAVDTIDVSLEIDNNSHVLMFGASSFGGTAPNTNYFNGVLDDIIIWSRSLNATDIQELYTLDACTFTIYDTLTVENVINVYDTLTIENIVDIFDTTYINVEVYDTLTVENIVNVYDTLIIENVVTVYDTLFTNVENIINVYDTTYTNIENVIDVYDTTTVVETVFEYDTLTIENIVEVYDTLTVENVIDVYDTTTVVETVLIYDTLTVENVIDVYDTTYVTVTDTLIIDVPTGVGGTILNTLLLYPNPTSDQLTISYGNFAAMAGYSLTIFDNGGSTVHETNITQAQETLDISQWSAGVYQVVVYNTGGVPVETRQIVIQ
jgi:hypothetical protein